MLKKITLSADEALIRLAKEKAQQEHVTLSAVFREWLTRYVKSEQTTKAFAALMSDLSYAKPGRSFTRDELNER